MDFLDFFENMGFGLGTILIIVVILILVVFIGRIIPVLFMGIGSIFFGLITLIVLLAVIYFIGKFVKDFIKWGDNNVST